MIHKIVEFFTTPWDGLADVLFAILFGGPIVLWGIVLLVSMVIGRGDKDWK